MKLESKFKEKLSRVLEIPSSNLYLFFKGRTALYCLLKAAGVKEGDEVLLQGFTCVAVPNAIIQTGARPVYVDIDPDCFNMSPEAAAVKISSATKVILVQNTFGLSTSVSAFRNLCSKRNLILIEDCTHGFGGQTEGQANGSLCDAAFYSTQWSKPFTTGLGGFAALFKPDRFPLKDFLTPPPPPLKREFSLILQNIFYSLFLNRYTTHLLKKVYRALYRLNLITGSSNAEELQAPPLSPSEVWSMGQSQAFFGLFRVRTLKDVMKKRRESGLMINRWLRENGKWAYPEKHLKDHSFLRFPLLAKSPAEISEYLQKTYYVSLGDWFNTPIYPVSSNLESWHYSPCPEAERISASIVNFPTESPALVARIISDPQVTNALKNTSN